MVRGDVSLLEYFSRALWLIPLTKQKRLHRWLPIAVCRYIRERLKALTRKNSVRHYENMAHLKASEYICAAQLTKLFRGWEGRKERGPDSAVCNQKKGRVSLTTDSCASG